MPTVNPLTFKGLDLSKDPVRKYFLNQLATILNELQTTLYNANALAGIQGGKYVLPASALKWSTSYFPTFTGNGTVDCNGLALISVRMIATSGATHTLTLNNVQQGAFINLEFANTSGATSTLKLAGTDQNGTTLAGTVLISGGTNGDVVANGFSQSNGLTLSMYGSLMNLGGTPTLVLTGTR